VDANAIALLVAGSVASAFGGWVFTRLRAIASLPEEHTKLKARIEKLEVGDFADAATMDARLAEAEAARGGLEKELDDARRDVARLHGRMDGVGGAPIQDRSSNG